MRSVLALVWKDIVAGRLVLAIVLPLFALKLWSMRDLGPAYVVVVMLSGFILGFGSLGLEETQRTEQTWMSLPVSRTQLVVARYLTVLTGLTIVFVPACLINPALTLPLVALLFAFALGAAIFLPAYFRWGIGRAMPISAIAWLVLSIPLGFAGFAWWGPALALALGLASLPLFALSAVVAARLYETRANI